MTGSSAQHVLNVENLNVSYGPIKAVRDISFHVDAAEIVTLLGANGAGKSSTLMSLMGLAPRDANTITLESQSIAGFSTEKIARSGMTLSPEGRRVFSNLTVMENLTLGGNPGKQRDDASVSEEQIHELFPILRERERQLAGTLSGGEQQMLAIARALMSKPRILLLDEPSLGLAPKYIELIFDLVVKLRDLGLTILLVEQNVDMSLEIADRAYVLANGKIVMSGNAGEVRDRGVEGAYLGIEEETA